MSDQTRMSINLSDEVAAAIQEIAERHNITVTEVIRRAVGTQKYIEDAALRGETIFIKGDNTALRELIFIPKDREEEL